MDTYYLEQLVWGDAFGKRQTPPQRCGVPRLRFARHRPPAPLRAQVFRVGAPRRAGEGEAWGADERRELSSNRDGR